MDLYALFRDQKKIIENQLYTENQVYAALNKDHLDLCDFAALLSPAAKPFLKEMAMKAQAVTRRHFGNAIQLFTPLYLANHCSNHCTYCGFSVHQKIARLRLTESEIEKELYAIRETGLREILLLTGEMPQEHAMAYLMKAIALSKKNFSTVGLEIMPLDTHNYAVLHQYGADFVSVYQETYDEIKYAQVHLSGKKRDFQYRFNAQERAILGGMHGVSFGALYGLSNPVEDAFATGLHAHLLQKKYPHAEINFSFPRIRPIGRDSFEAEKVSEAMLFQFLLAFRLFMPHASLTLSTRERSFFRNHACQYVVNKISAEAKVTVGGHSTQNSADVQFEIADNRSVSEMLSSLKQEDLQPVFSNHIHTESLL